MLCFSSCKSSKHSKIVTKKERVNTNKEAVITKNDNVIANKIVQHAMEYSGVRYKYGGENKKGMDCSGLIVTAFNREAIILPRTTKNLSVSGNWIDLKTVEKGDLLFFATKKNSRHINHVGIVTDITKDDVQFIHSTTSKGVITSLLSERYWYLAFVQARRVL
jgi:cell wall-associated NlpC family hydrolase